MKHNPSGLVKSVGLFVAAITLCAAQTSKAGVGGFVDAQAISGTNATANATAQNSVGFAVADGAVYLSKELGKGKVLLDLPFAYTNGSAAGTLGFAAAAKAQAFVNFGYDFGLDWTLGRFDSPFVSVESNDSVNLAYAFQSGLYAALPHIHQGLMLNYAIQGFSVKALVSNNAGTATRADAGNAYAENYEYGVLAKYAHDMFWVGAGFYLHKPAAGTETGTLIDISAGTKVSDLAIDLEAVMTKVPVSGADSGFAVAANFWYTINKTWGVGIRPEYNSKLTNVYAVGTGANYSQFQVTAGPSCNLTEDLKVRLNYVFASTKGNTTASTATVPSATWTDAGTSTSSHAGVLSAVYKF